MGAEKDQVQVRLSPGQAAVLDALVALERTNRNRVARQLVTHALESTLEDPLVQAQMKLHAKHDAREEAGITRIDKPRAGGTEGA